MEYLLYLPGQAAISLNNVLANRFECSIGAGAGCDFQVQDKFVQQKHLTLMNTQQGLLLIPEQGGRYTLVNGELANPTIALKPGFYKLILGKATISLDIFSPKKIRWWKNAWIKFAIVGILSLAFIAHQVMTFQSYSVDLEGLRQVHKDFEKGEKTQNQAIIMSDTLLKGAYEQRGLLLLKPPGKTFHDAVSQTLWLHAYRAKAEKLPQMDSAFTWLKTMLPGEHALLQYPSFKDFDVFLYEETKKTFVNKGLANNKPLEQLKDLAKSLRYNALDTILSVAQRHGELTEEEMAILDRNGINFVIEAKKDVAIKEKTNGLKRSNKSRIK